ncbi:MAG: serine hydrolase [Planctomycetota bacterium]
MHASRWLLSFMLAAAGVAGTTAAQAIPVEVGAPQIGTLETADAKSYSLDLAASQFVLGAVEQVSVDVVVTISGPAGQRVGRFDGPGRGAEEFQFESGAAGKYRIEVAPYEEERGDYELLVRRVEAVATDSAGRVDQLMSAYDRPEVPGGVVAVVQGGELTFARAYGAANLTHGIPFAVDTRTNIGSTSKQFTAMAILLLAQRGKLTLDDDVRKHIPELPDFGETVTLRHLLSHSSGYREFINTLALAGRRIGDGDYVGREEIIAIVQRQPELQNEPGAEFNYNNTGFALLAMIVERISGDSFVDWMATNVFAPLDMNDTCVRATPAQIVSNSAMGYVSAAEGGYHNGVDIGGSTGAGGIYTTVSDLAKWVRNYKTGEVGGAEAIAQMMTKSKLNDGSETSYGLGLFLDEFGGQRRVHHGGADTAHRSMVMYFPELDVGIITQSNNAGFNGSIADSVARVFLGEHLESEEDPKEENPEPADTAEASFDPTNFDAASFEAMAGRYEMEEMAGFVLTFTSEGDRFFVQATGQSKVEMTPSSATSFAMQSVDASVTFHRSDDGAFEALTLHQNGDHRANRIEEAPWAPAAEQLARYVGRYRSAELETVYELTIVDGKLTLQHRRLDPITLTPVEEHEFTGGFPVADVVFHTDEEGAVTALEASNRRTRGVRFSRLAE